MYLSEGFRGFGGEPQRRSVPSRSSKGYPEVRDPAAENPSGILKGELDEASLRRLRQRYSMVPNP